MANYYICALIFRLMLPLFMLACVVFRPCALSYLYLLLACYLPFVPVPTPRKMNGGHTGIFLIIFIVISVLTTLAQLIFQIVIFSLPKDENLLKDCEELEKILRHVGFVRLNDISAKAAITWLSPEIIMLIASVSSFVTLRKLSLTGPPESGSEEGTQDSITRFKKNKRKYLGILVAVGRYLILFVLCLAAVLRPSVQGGLYFLIFLSAATWWACYKQLGKGFAILLRCLAVFVFIHLSVFYAYQAPWPQEYLEQNSTYARYFGLTPLYSFNCQDPRELIFSSSTEWASYLNPFVLYYLFYLLILLAKGLLKPESQKKQGPFSRLEGSFTGQLGRQVSQRITRTQLMRTGTTKKRWQNATRKVRDKIVSKVRRDLEKTYESTPLIRGVSPSRRYGSNRKIIQDSTGSVTVTGDNHEEIPMDQLGKGTTEEEYKPSVLENVLYAFDQILQVIIKSSYIGTNIIMMAWSITYLSWITFVLLIWANLLWLVPNQRKSMLRSSPFLVIYAWFLLISAYVYSMNLTEEELPSTIQGINLAQIGFVKVTHLPCNPLLVKCLFTAMFWITLRQFMHERMTQKQTSALADMVAPLQVTVGTATGVTAEQQKSSKLMDKIGKQFSLFLTKFWIWVVAITLFAVAITGQRMTVFRIIYMALFLIFVLSFQISFRVWRKMMFAFWLTVIVYSMIILVMVYTYQFDNFPYYWEEYLHVPIKQQLDIGLEIFETKQLFVRLVTPTFFVIITVIQLHYFHKNFMTLSDIRNTNVIAVDLEESSLQGGAALTNNDKDQATTTTSSIKFDLSEVGRVSSAHFKEALVKWLKRLHHMMNLTYLFLEIHMPKVVMFFAMLLCIYDKCALYIIVIILIVLALTFGRPMMVIAIFASSFYASIMLLARMIYQIQYIEPGNWNVTCYHSNDTNGTIENNAHWFGFDKSNSERSLPSLVKWNIIYILVVTLWSVITVRQFNYRISRGKPTTRAYFMFPRITRAEADKNLKNCLKYLANYLFFKFGVELSLMATVALIGFRMDMYALIYSIWLLILISCSRSILSRIWNVYLIFIAVILPIQYIMVLGLPPTLCIDYPWDHSEMLRRFQEWAYVMDADYPPAPKKLICDFILLLFVSRQALVFRIEKRNENKDYPGGSNESIIHLAEDRNFKNPVPDFITYVRSYLDVFKKGVLQGFLWITLALVFLAGTNRVNVFSLGYLIGAFIFLWQGSDLYLRPIPKILKSWNALLYYNVVSILLKVALQIVGCVFIHQIPSGSCWVVQLFGIGCVKKFGNIVKQVGLEDPDECKVPREFIGLVWDGLCFGFLIMQKRIFQSYNFFHMIDEIKATTILASRGADLIEELRQERITEQEEQEHRVLQKIKAKMDRIKATQQKIQGSVYKDSKKHYVDQPTLARSTSTSSCTSATSQQTTPAGYHTPIDEEEPTPLTPRSSLIQPQAPSSPFSAIMTVSLEGYLEPQRISFSSPPNSELNPRPPSPDDSFPVFSPPPYDEAPPYAEAVSEAPTMVQRQQSIGPPWMAGSLITPRQSVISYSSRSPLSHHEYTVFDNRPRRRRRPAVTYKQAVRSGDYYMFDELEDDEIDLEPEEIPVDPNDPANKELKPNLGELLSSALKSQGSRRSGRSELNRRLSMPLSRQKSSYSARSQISVPFSAPPTIEEHERETDKPIEPQPSTSKDEELSELSEPKQLTFGEKILGYLMLAWVFIEGGMVSMTNFLNRYSKDYRYIIRVLTREKKILKEKTNYNIGNRVGSGQVWQPAGSYHSLLRHKDDSQNSTLSRTSLGIYSPSDSYRLAIISDRLTTLNSESGEKPPLSETTDTKAMAAPLPYTAEEERRKASVLTVPEIRILAPSLERGLDSPFSSSSSSVPTSLYDEFEGEMSSYDQPTIVRLLLAIWYIIMSRSELLCYFVIFLNQIKSATFLSLPLPLMVFFWGSLTVPRPSKTFWITIIAYTEIIVLVKCMFQFDIIPWNRNAGVINNPFYPPRIIGIERKKAYAVWDLLLLLIVFFHRFMLKSLGLWKSVVPVPAVLISEGDYRIEGGELVLADSTITSDSKKSKSIKSLNKDEEDKPDRQDSSIVPDEDENLLSLQSTEMGACNNLTNVFGKATSKYSDSLRLFFNQLLNPSTKQAVDVYSFMFVCDFFNFFVILIGYSSFGAQQGDGGVSSYLEDNRVPVLFLVMLILQFMLIIIDRGIFLRKNILGKLIFQYSQIFLLHMWLFVLFPIMTGSQFNSVLPPQMYYMVKCFYLLLSSYQIRCGYPSRILGNFLCKGYNYANMFLFKGFMLIPFLFELRTVMDWMWTDTSMTVFDWIKMEDIFAHIFQLKCVRHVEDEYPQARGERKKPLIKYFMGGGILAVIIAIIWFPLVFFSLGNAVGQPNVPYDVTLEIRIGPYEPVYQMSAQNNSIYPFSEDDLQNLLNSYNEEKTAASFISNYEALDIAAIKLNTDSANIWSISPPDRRRMVDEIQSSKPITVRLEYKISHKTSKPEDSGVIPDSIEIIIPPGVGNETNPVRDDLLNMLDGKPSSAIILEYLMPKFLKVTNRGTAKPITQLMKSIPVEAASSYRNISLNLLRPVNQSGADKEWWQIHEQCSDYNYNSLLKKLPYNDCEQIILYTFNDKIFPSTLNLITGGGIIGLYTTLVFVASRVLRGFFAEQCFKIMFEDMPNVDRVLQLCLDIYLVREAREFILEEDLFAKLVFLFRSPETLIKWTRPKEELEDDDDPEGDEQ